MSNVLGELFGDIANAIREKTGDTATMKPAEFPTKISGIEVGGGGSSADVRYITFMSDDGAVEFGRLPVAVGYDCPNPKFAVTKESTAQYHYDLAGWATTPNGAMDTNALKEVNENRTVYANFAAILRYYTITYLDTDGSVLKTESLAYGAMPSSNYTPMKDGFVFDGWNPTLAPVTGDASYTVVWFEQVTFAGSSWAKIAEICEAGKAAEMFAVGDVKDVKIGYNNVSVVILGFNHDDLASGGKAAISLALTSALSDTQGLNAQRDWIWSTSPLRTKIAGYLNSLPDDLKAIVKPVKKVTQYDTDKTQTTTESLWPLSLTEAGCYDYGEGSIYEYFGTKYSNQADTKRALGKNYWIRSFYATNGSVCWISTSGNMQSGSSTQTKYCHFGFCI